MGRYIVSQNEEYYTWRSKQRSLLRFQFHQLQRKVSIQFEDKLNFLFRKTKTCMGNQVMQNNVQFMFISCF